MPDQPCLEMQVAGSAIKAVLFQLSHDLQPVGDSKAAASRGLEPLEQSSWSYYNPEKGKEVRNQLGCALTRCVICECHHAQHAAVLSCTMGAPIMRQRLASPALCRRAVLRFPHVLLCSTTRWGRLCTRR